MVGGAVEDGSCWVSGGSASGTALRVDVIAALLVSSCAVGWTKSGKVCTGRSSMGSDEGCKGESWIESDEGCSFCLVAGVLQGLVVT